MTAFTAELTGDQEVISALTERVTADLVDCGIDAHAVHHMALVLDELLTNVAVHGGAGNAGVSVHLTVSSDRVTAEVVDGGKMFDPRVEFLGRRRTAPDRRVGIVAGASGHGRSRL
jgi:anti-sigma regulatory factor (Ser/Thr protein kinase)